MPRSCCVKNSSNNAKSQWNLNFYILPFDKQRRRHWLQTIGRAQQRLKILHASLVDQLYAKEIFLQFCGKIEWSNASNDIHPNVFNSFYRTVTHGESQGIIYNMNKFIFRWSPHFSPSEPPNRNPRKQVHFISKAHHHSPISRNNSRRHMIPVVNN